MLKAKLSCTTPKSAQQHLQVQQRVLASCGVFWMAVRLGSCQLAPEARQDGAALLVSILVAQPVMPGSVDSGGWVAGSESAEDEATAAERAADRYQTT